MRNETNVAASRASGVNRANDVRRFTLVRPFLPRRCPLPPSVRVPVTSANRGLLRLLRSAELEAWSGMKPR
ncbi:MAG TPA: hypothetical protein VNU68_03920 [Verrucomicrobiae bacterium]|nr:hypothetical protein [Verrucomicrobiae bacterium]